MLSEDYFLANGPMVGSYTRRLVRRYFSSITKNLLEEEEEILKSTI
jgi:hypothetical protein